MITDCARPMRYSYYRLSSVMLAGRIPRILWSVRQWIGTRRNRRDGKASISGITNQHS